MTLKATLYRNSNTTKRWIVKGNKAGQKVGIYRIPTKQPTIRSYCPITGTILLNAVICSPLQKHEQNNLFFLFKAFNTVTYRHARVFGVKFSNEFDARDFVATYNRIYEEQVQFSGSVALEDKEGNVYHKSEEEENAKEASCTIEDSGAVDDDTDDDVDETKDEVAHHDFDNDRKSMGCGEEIEDIEKEFEFDHTQDFPAMPFYPASVLK